MAAIPPDVPRDVGWKFVHLISLAALGLRRRDMNNKPAARSIGLAEMAAPVEREKILWPERRDEGDVDDDRDLGVDEA